MRIKMLIVVMAALCAAGCSTPAAPPSPQAGGDTSSSSRSAVDDIQGLPVDLSFTVTTANGKTFAGSTLAGKPALVWFWAPWCPICESQIPAVQELVQKYQGRLTIVGVGGLDAADRIRKADEVLPGVLSLVDAKGEVWSRFRITDQATYAFLGSDGQRKWIDHDLNGTLGGLIAHAAS
jgi:thiol-disulfide isomerase/thioredoxin